MKKTVIILLLYVALLGAKSVKFERIGDFLVKEVSSGIDYPDKGDEHISTAYDGKIYKVDILHPVLTDKYLHISVPFFTVSDAKHKDEIVRDGIVTMQVEIAMLGWYSGCDAYFFVQQGTPLRGFFLQDGMDNQDAGVGGIIFIYDGKRARGYFWEHDDGMITGRFVITDGKSGQVNKKLLKNLKPILDYFEKRADGWPGA